MSVINSHNKKFAAIIAINYTNTSNQLNGCVNDAIHLKTFLMEKCGYKAEEIVMLSDSGVDTLPTKKNIENLLDTLIAKANEGYDEIWFSYSGHGSYIADTNGDEKDNCDECICPLDCDINGMILDDYIYENFVCKLPASCNLFCLMDCCHSGSILDLPFIYGQSGKFEKNNDNDKHVANVISISGCQDPDVSSDAYIGKEFRGAMTWSFLNALYNSGYDIKLVDLIEKMRVLLSKKYTQIPMLAVSSKEHFDREFIGKSSYAVVPVVSTRQVKFQITADHWYKESTFNIQHVQSNKFLFDTFQPFTSKNQTVEFIKDLKPGYYRIKINDSGADGGVKCLITCGLVTLLKAKMTSGRMVSYDFIV